MPIGLFEKDSQAESSGKQASVSPSVSISALSRDGSCSAFSPYKPTTVLTNVQRGNVQTQTSTVITEKSLHQLAAQGELFLHNIGVGEGLDDKDEHGLTALMWAASYGQLETVRLLIKHGASVTEVGVNGENSLLLASASGHAAIVKELLGKGADVNHKDEEGNTALMYAAFNNHAMCAHELLVAGADVTLDNEVFDSAFDIAVKRRSKQVQAVIEKHMIKLLLEAKE